MQLENFTPAPNHCVECNAQLKMEEMYICEDCFDYTVDRTVKPIAEASKLEQTDAAYEQAVYIMPEEIE